MNVPTMAPMTGPVPVWSPSTAIATVYLHPDGHYSVRMRSGAVTHYGRGAYGFDSACASVGSVIL